MNKRNTSVALLATASMLAMITGCGDKSATATSTPSATTAATKAPVASATPAPATPAAPAGLKGELEIQYFVGGYGDKWWKAIISEFEAANPGLKVKQTAGSQINDQMKPRWIKGDPPDVVYIDGAGSNEAQMVADDQLLEISDWIKEAKNVDGDKIVDNLFAKPKDYSGKNYTIPLVYGSWGTFYDIKFFEDNGWKAPTNFEEFMAVSKQIKDSGKGVFPYIHTGKYPYYISGGFMDSAIIAANGGDPSILLKMEANEEGIYKSEPVKKALDKLMKIVNADFIDPASKAINHTDSQMMFLQHKDAFIPNGLWVENEMAGNVPDGFKFGFIASLGIDAGQKSVVVPYTSTMAIAKKAKNVDAAKAFVQFIYTKQSAVKWAELSGVPMNYKADLESSKAGSMSKAAMKFFLDPGTVTAPTVVLEKDVEEARNNALIALTTKEITPEKWIERMEAAAKKAREKKK